MWARLEHSTRLQEPGLHTVTGQVARACGPSWSTSASLPLRGAAGGCGGCTGWGMHRCIPLTPFPSPPHTHLGEDILIVTRTVVDAPPARTTTRQPAPPRHAQCWHIAEKSPPTSGPHQGCQATERCLPVDADAAGLWRAEVRGPARSGRGRRGRRSRKSTACVKAKAPVASWPQWALATHAPASPPLPVEDGLLGRRPRRGGGDEERQRPDGAAAAGRCRCCHHQACLGATSGCMSRQVVVEAAAR